MYARLVSEQVSKLSNADVFWLGLRLRSRVTVTLIPFWQVVYVFDDLEIDLQDKLELVLHTIPYPIKFELVPYVEQYKNIIISLCFFADRYLLSPVVAMR